MGKLYLVSTPIGNLDDITLRAIKILGDVDWIACEDTRKTGQLISKLNLPKKKFISYFEENEHKRIPELIQLLCLGNNIALVSDAGTPTISDPGFKLVRECLSSGIDVISIPGPTAFLTALVVSGLPTDKFFFLGFVPQKEGKKFELLNNCKLLSINCTLIFYESPYRLLNTLLVIQSVFGNIDVVIGRELTKMFEEIKRGKVTELLLDFKNKKLKGEFVILFHHRNDNENIKD